MTTYNTDLVLKDILLASKNAAAEVWDKIKVEVSEDFKNLARIGARIVARQASGTITEVNARFLMAQYYGAARNFLFSLEGIANTVIERVVNAVIGVLRESIRIATGGWIVI